MTDYIATGGRFPILLVACDRSEQLDRALGSLLNAVRCVRPADIVVVQDGHCTSAEVSAVIARHKVRSHRAPQRMQDDGGNPPDGAARIASHYGYALEYALSTAFPHAPAVVVAEDDFLFASDWYEYFHAVAPALESDTSLWLASAWNDNGFDYLVADPYGLKRTRYFPGLGWLLPRRVWTQELRAQWPQSHWDHWMRDPRRHLGRDILVPEINRNYHAGIKGTFMDTQTHNKYFGSIALQGDTRFTWDTPEGARAIQSMLQPTYDRDLYAVLGSADTVHVRSIDQLLQIRSGTAIVWYSATPNSPQHDPSRPMAAFFGIWHEGARGSRGGVHDIWWLGSARLYLINACGQLGSSAVTGSTECSPLTEQFMPRDLQPLAPAAFSAALSQKPMLPIHSNLFNAVLQVPLAHIEGGADANGPPDRDANRGGGAAAAVDAADIQRLRRRRQKRRVGGVAGDLGANIPEHGEGAQGSAGGAGGGPRGAQGLDPEDEDYGEGHRHKAFLGDLHIPKGGPGKQERQTKRKTVVHAKILSADVSVVAADDAGLTCTQVCEQQTPALQCDAPSLPLLNDCTTMRSYFDCGSCQDNQGSDQPAMVDWSAPFDKLPGACLINKNPSLFSCDGRYEHAQRLCPCRKRQ
jgi:alpha-1,3-mannosyl-glycoprotein beta-1,2-N-acetylglucosaminyltransferase